MSVSQVLNDVFGVLNEYFWYIAFVFLVGLGLYFTYKLNFLQILKIKETSSLAVSGASEKSKHKTLSSFEAFCMQR